MGDKFEKRQVAKQLGAEGQMLLNLKQSRQEQERQRDQFETYKCQQRQQQDWSKAQADQEAKRAQARAIAEENRRMAEMKKANQVSSRVNQDMQEQMNIHIK